MEPVKNGPEPIKNEPKPVKNTPEAVKNKPEKAKSALDQVKVKAASETVEDKICSAFELKPASSTVSVKQEPVDIVEKLKEETSTVGEISTSKSSFQTKPKATAGQKEASTSSDKSTIREGSMLIMDVGVHKPEAVDAFAAAKHIGAAEVLVSDAATSNTSQPAKGMYIVL